MIIAGCTVVIAVLGLILTGLSYMYGVAIATALAVLVVMLASITLLPALLSYLGPRVDNLRIPLLGRTLRTEARRRGVAGRTLDSRRPAAPLAGGDHRAGDLLALAAPALGMRLGFPDAGNDPPDSMTRQAYDLNTDGFGPGTNGPMIVAQSSTTPQEKAKMNDLANKIRSIRTWPSSGRRGSTTPAMPP